MQLDIKFKSIAGRWFFNIFLIVAIIVCTAVISFSVIYSSIYTERIETLANDLTYEFNSLSNSSKTAFKENAVELAGSFAYKNKLEVQVIDRNDNIVVSTTGFQPTEQRMPDYEKAIKTGETETSRLLEIPTNLYRDNAEALVAMKTAESTDQSVMQILEKILTPDQIKTVSAAKSPEGLKLVFSEEASVTLATRFQPTQPALLA